MIQILRLKNGEDIIGEVNQNGNDFEINEPMSVGYETRGGQSGLIMSHWLPVQLIDKNITTIHGTDVLTTFNPNKEFEDYYLDTVERFHRVIEAKKVADSMTDEEIQEVMDIMEIESGNKTLH